MLELEKGKRVQYRGMKSARILANLFKHFHTSAFCEVTEEISKLTKVEAQTQTYQRLEEQRR